MTQTILILCAAIAFGLAFLVQMTCAIVDKLHELRGPREVHTKKP